MRWKWEWLAGAFILAFATMAIGGKPESAADRGRAALTGRSFIPSAWNESAYAKAGTQWGAGAVDPSQKPEEYAAAFRTRYGLHPAPYPNDGLPMGLRKARDKDGKTPGLQIDCMVCHGGSIGGTSYVGLGNTQLDMRTFLREMTLADNKLVGPDLFILNSSRGTVNAGQIAIVLLSLRNPDLSMRKFPLLTGANLPELDVPAWWILAKKSTQYYDGRTDARSARSNMQFMLADLTLDQFKTLEPTFQDIQAYFRSIQPPKYPFAIDREKAERGRGVFSKNCAKCHGTYGENPSYPNEVVARDIIGTDPARAKGISNRFVAHYNSTWFGEDYKVDTTMTGYQAPPLDGIWATAPYLHNGSVPTLFHMLKSTERPAKFLRPPSTSFDHYDTTKVGWKAEPFDPEASPSDPKRVFDSSRWGLGNKGHTFGDRLTHEERMAVIEYLKTL